MTAPSPTLLIETSMQAVFFGKSTPWRDCWSVLLASLQAEPLHVVVAYDEKSQHCHVITAYRPDLTHFNADLITRRLS